MDWLKYENEAYCRGYEAVCGVDEAGRGPLAGPVFAAAVILPYGRVIEGVDDSKKLSEKKRLVLFDQIRREATAFSIRAVDEQVIDEINVLKATMLAMRQAVDSLPVAADFALIDGNSMPKLSIEGKCIIKGDSLSCTVAAASILAKVARDKYMLEMARQYPEYGFEKHKGYGTKLHRDMLLQHGPSKIHRKTFLKKILGKTNEK